MRCSNALLKDEQEGTSRRQRELDETAVFAGTSAELLRIRMRIWERTGDERAAVADARGGRQGGTGYL